VTNVCVVGLGKIGLPLALLLAKANHRVFGIDSNSHTLYKILNNKLDRTNAKIQRMLLEQFLGKRLFVTEDPQAALSESEVVFIAIGTGIFSDGTPKLSNLFGLVEKICSNPDVVKGRLFVFKTTVPG